MNLPEDTIHTRKQLRDTFVGNFQGTWTRPPTSETLRQLKQKNDESLKDFVTWFCKVCIEIMEIDDIEVIIAFKDAVRYVKTIEMLALKKPKTVAKLLGIAEQCVEMAEARA